MPPFQPVGIPEEVPLRVALWPLAHATPEFHVAQASLGLGPMLGFTAVSNR